jgi:putative flippase GtrA
MRAPSAIREGGHAALVARYVVNGLAATAVHFAVLSLNLKVLHVPSAGLSNLCAAIVGLTASFLGNRYFVFRRPDEPLAHQALRFALLYGAIACLHGAVLFAWSDVAGLDYRAGFLLATALQMVLSYFGNKTLVFRA